MFVMLFQLVKDRTFHVSADGYKSSTKPISAGVPQGSVLVPTRPTTKLTNLFYSLFSNKRMTFPPRIERNP